MHYWSGLFCQDSWILANFLLFIFMDWDKVKVKKKHKEEWQQYPVILTEQAWSIKDFNLIVWQ